MYLAIVILTMAVLPAVSVVANLGVVSPAPAVWTAGETWFVFWAFGVRLLTAGVRQALQPAFTAEHIFEIPDPRARVIVRELGFANIAFGTLGILALWNPGWRVPADLLGLLFYGLAGASHIFKKKNRTEWIATVSDLYAAAVFLGFLVLAR